MKSYCVLLISILVLRCTTGNTQILKKQLSSELTYKPLHIPDYFTKLRQHYSESLFALDSATLTEFCIQHQLDERDLNNRARWTNIYFLHRLLTSSTAQNGSLGPVLKIPYFWHWLNPNPRHSIVDLRTGKVLTKTPTISEFKNYKSYADIDRTPSLFLKELFSPNALYSHEACDSFSTFGWCSEREAAFSCLMDIYGYQSKVIVKGNHSWSVHLVYFKNKSGSPICFEATTDNTFDVVTFKKINSPNLTQWHKETGDPGLAKWHNEKAHSLHEQTVIKSFIVSEKAFKEIEQSLRNFLIKTL